MDYGDAMDNLNQLLYVIKLDYDLLNVKISLLHFNGSNL